MAIRAHRVVTASPLYRYQGEERLLFTTAAVSAQSPQRPQEDESSQGYWKPTCLLSSLNRSPGRSQASVTTFGFNRQRADS